MVIKFFMKENFLFLFDLFLFDSEFPLFLALMLLIGDRFGLTWEQIVTTTFSNLA